MSSTLMSGFSMWRRQGTLEFLRHVKLVALRRLHHVLWDRRFETYENVPTGGYLLTEHLEAVDDTNLDQAREYLPSPRLVVRWLLEGLNEDLSGFSFVDYGSGRGRVLLAAAAKPFRAVRGVEFSTRLHGEAMRNIAGYPDGQLVCADVKSVCADATEFDLPEGDCVLYFFNPFGAALIETVITRAIETARRRNSRLIVVLYNPVYRHVADRNRYLAPRRLTFASRLKLNLLSPYPAVAYDLTEVTD